MRAIRTTAAAAVLAAVTGVVAPAAAQTSMVNGVPTAELEANVAFWYASTKFKVNLSDPVAGPLSSLNWSGVSSANIELNTRLASLSTGLFARIGFGGGWNLGGNMNDLDYSGGSVISNTSSSLDTQQDYYFSGDIGWTPNAIANWRLKLSPFAGLFFINSSFGAKGLSCNTVNAAFGCAALGPVAGISQSEEVVANSVTFWGPRVGLAASYPITDRISIGGEAAYLFFGQYKNKDSHEDPSRTCDPSNGGGCVGPTPNFVDTSSSGSAVQLQATVDYKFPDSSWTLGGGFRWWHFDSGTAAALACAQCSPVYQSYSSSTNTFDMTGVFIRANYGF